MPAAALDLGVPAVAGLAARCTFPTGPLDLAVSGGPDSLALLVLGAATGAEVTAWHVDHGLRTGSAAEAEVVAEVAGRCGARFEARTVIVEPGANLEARARAARLAALPPGACTGHTADDRAETVLLHLLRGSGPAGLAGIRRSPRRPLLDLRRHETRGLCAALGLAPIEDPSNLDPAHRRNRVRHELLPLLDDIAARDVVPLLVRQADLLAAVDDALADAAGAVDPTSARALAAAPEAVAGAAVRRWLVAAGVGEGYGVDHAAVARVLAVARNERRATEVVGGGRVTRSAGRLAVVPPPACKDAAHG